MTSFEQLIRELTAEINGQYPRPWMTDCDDPSRAKVFVVGYNPANAYKSEYVNYERFVNALFNRNEEKCRSFYYEITNSSPSRTTIQDFTLKLAEAGVRSVIETNIICYSTGKKEFLRLPEHRGGKERGLQIFRALFKEIRPRAVILHGKGVLDEFKRAFPLIPPLPNPPSTEDQFVEGEMENSKIFVIPSLAMPGFQNWPKGRSFCNWANDYLNEISKRVARVCLD